MKVIREPSPTYHLECNYCNALIECRKDELTHRELLTGRGPRSAWDLVCPLCQHVSPYYSYTLDPHIVHKNQKSIDDKVEQLKKELEDE